MALIKKPTEIDRPKNVRVMIFGSAGSGKTTFALSAPDTLLLDFDNGVHRLEPQHRTDTVQVQSFRDVLEVLQSEELKNYNNIVVDTVGKLLDYIIIHICGARQPRIQDWGTINKTFADFNRTLYHSGKNVIYVAHRDTRKESEDTIFIPALREKSYVQIVSDIDLLGYLEMTTGGRTLTFNPTNRNEGKNTCKLPAQIYIPDATGKTNTAFQNLIIDRYKEICLAQTEDEKKYDELMDAIKEAIELITDERGADEFVKAIDTFKHIGSSKRIAAELLKKKTDKLGLVYNSKTKKYESVNNSKDKEELF
jgi:phage nucleotide-binding protein